jgi:hypothetical protein
VAASQLAEAAGRALRRTPKLLGETLREFLDDRCPHLVLENVPLRESGGRRQIAETLTEITSSAGGVRDHRHRRPAVLRQRAHGRAPALANGSIATAIAFAFFVFLSANVFLAGAELAAVRSRLRVTTASARA